MPPVHKRGEEDQFQPGSIRSFDSSEQFSSDRTNTNSDKNSMVFPIGEEGKALVPPDQFTDEDFDMRGTSRKDYENEYYKRVCSEILDDFLYLGSDFMARDAELFKK